MPVTDEFVDMSLDFECSIEEREQTDYWVSQERKYCEFCKCYVSGNKPSIDFHENGKNHRDNVAKRITQLQKKASKEAKDAEKHETEMKKIEAAALKSYAKDVEENPDISSETFDESQCPDVVQLSKNVAPQNGKYNKDAEDAEDAKSPDVEWVEAWSGRSERLSRNPDAKQSTYDRPNESCSTPEDQQKFKEKGFRSRPARDGMALERNRDKGKQKKDKFRQKENERDELRGFTVKPIGNEDDLKSNQRPGVQCYPYGRWEVVPIESESPKDLQLPVPQKEPVKAPVQISELEEIFDLDFQEKKIPIAGSIPSNSGETAFKKRKVATDTKTNIRQRTADD